MNIVENVLQEHHLSYEFYSKPLSNKSQQVKFKKLCLKKPKYVFIVMNNKKTEPYFKNILEHTSQHLDDEQSFEEDNLVCGCFRGEQRYFVYSDIEEDVIKEELYNEVVIGENPNICLSCQEHIRTQTIPCQTCKEARLCTFCFTKRVLAENKTQCDFCNGDFVRNDTKAFMDDMIQLYQKNPRDLFTTIQKRKKELPPGLKNLGQIVQSALKEAKRRGDPLPTQLSGISNKSLPRNVNI